MHARHVRSFLLSLLVLAGAGACASVATAASAEAPNIVYILADDLGYGDVQCYNPERGRIPTPNIDRLATEGLRFTDAHANASVCTPTRYGILTGRYAWRTRLQQGVLAGYVEPLIAADRLTVPGMLHAHGYHTACIGKWHLGFTIQSSDQEGAKGPEADAQRAAAPLGARTPDGPITRGFDVFYGFHHARSMEALFEADTVVERVSPVDMLPKLVDRATGYIAARAAARGPFFLYFALNAPHTPIVPSQAWRGRSGLGDYADYVMETDWAVGAILNALQLHGLVENTLVIFTSDNGCSPVAGVDQLEAAGHFPSAQYRGYKSDIWEGGHRIPFIVRWPGIAPAGETCDQLVSLTDLIATCADLLDVKLPDNAGEDSVSFLPLLRDQHRVVRKSMVQHSHHGRFAMREGKWKLALCPGSGGWSAPGDAEVAQRGGPEVQLYDLEADPAETRNLADEQPAIVARLRKLLDRQIAEGRSTPGAPQANDAPIIVQKPNRPSRPLRRAPPAHD